MRIDPRWVTRTVADLAIRIYSEESFVSRGGPAPILADALMDAGCDNEKITDALRSRASKKVSRAIVRDILIADGAMIARSVEEARQMIANMGGMGEVRLDMASNHGANMIGYVTPDIVRPGGIRIELARSVVYA